MPTPRRKFGDWGESLAKAFLLQRGFVVLNANYHKRCGELDIIARRGVVLHFVEVKTRTTSAIARFGQPEEAIGRGKRQRIIRTAYAYLAENGLSADTDWQIDVITVVRDSKVGRIRIRLIENAFDES
jgi:putative endonuclease